jgi:uncharacterized Ntn-hydrolase superfamily protein
MTPARSRLALLAAASLAVSSARSEDSGATFSIVAHDPATAETGVAIKSRSFRTARGVWARPGVGGIVTQALKNLSHGADGLRLLESGLSPAEVVKRLAEPDPLRGDRQFAVVDVRGRVAAYTGAAAYYAAGDVVGDGFAVQGNNLENEQVVPALAKAFREAKGDLAERMLAALQAGQALGGDGRGYGSAGITVVKDGFNGEGPEGDPTHVYPYWVDLRVDYSKDPLAELAFLLRVTRARRLTATSHDLAAHGKTDEAIQAQKAALAILPDDEQLHYYLAERYAAAGRVDDAICELRRAVATSPALRYAAMRSESFRKVRDARLAEFLGPPR